MRAGRTAPSRAVPAFDRGLATWAALVLAVSLAGWLGRWHWLADLVSHFRVYHLAAAALGLAACLRRPRPVPIACLALALAVNAWALLPFWLPVAAPAPPEGATPLDIVAINVRRINHDFGRTLDYLRAAGPDVAVVIEPDDAWAAALERLADAFPHRVIRPRPDNFGLAVLSKWPLADATVVDFADVGYPNLVARVEFPGCEFLLVATHPHPPVTPGHARRHSTQLAAIAGFAARSALPCIVAGDFNATPWSAPYRRFAAASGLRDTAIGRGARGTWNARLPAPRIPIDHVFAPPEAVVLRRTVGPDVGSDHFPVEVRLLLPPAQR